MLIKFLFLFSWENEVDFQRDPLENTLEKYFLFDFSHSRPNRKDPEIIIWVLSASEIEVAM